MAGTSFAVIRKRINSINNTKKITKAMSLVATSKLRKNKERLYINNQYKANLHKVILNMLSSYEEGSILVDGNGSNKKLYIVITSELGLCAGYNANVISKLKESIKENNNEYGVFVIGQKGLNSIKRINYDILKEYTDIPSVPTFKYSKNITKDILDLYLNEEVGEVNIIYTEFISTIKREVKVERILPIDLNSDSKENEIYELENFEILDEVIKSYIEERLFNAMLNGRTSEESSRMEAMNGATKNANDILDKLSIQYNRLRQSVITQEISEIVGGAEAQR
ncbi:ATP synthase F1 subunit gamma [Hathewaya histolytica]|uniref:ATP synthase gamma chain n=1 Tax=Hathewaya histolytica TaxID=1498 RepID=A0A4U9RR08_HATHI|nr:ATP synthase F1 subunit gamma [Hathewaya histolytica]VTQ94118.1 F0F1 ATP synthase subunit gamma [Hathewaya histolytica]